VDRPSQPSSPADPFTTPLAELLHLADDLERLEQLARRFDETPPVLAAPHSTNPLYNIAIVLWERFYAAARALADSIEPERHQICMDNRERAMNAERALLHRATP
jgi:hypothetical protein